MAATLVGMVTDVRFEELVGEALDSLPAWVQEQLENVEVLIEEHAPRDDPNLLGLYEGIPLTERSPTSYFGVLPDRISLFRRNIVAESGGDEEQLKRVVAHTVVHEFAHFFGISDDRLREIDRY